jgi:molybdopterin synthase sulfur carrier subunit
MQVHVRYFAVLRERRGCADEAVTLAAPVTVGELYSTLFPPTAAGALPVMYAVNEAYVPADHPLDAGDEVAFIPPLGGG